MISIRNITRNYGEIRAVDDVSLDIARGEVVGLLGHNGAGKTTLMKMLTGFLDPSSGSARVGDVDVLEDRIGVQRLIGYLPESAPLYPEMLVQQYLAMMAELRGVPEGEVQRAVVEAARATGLEEHLIAPIRTLSKGYRQRVGFAQAIVHGPEVLVLDEPTNGLDPVQIQSIRDLILRLAQNTTVILSTHILQEIEAVCDRVLVMIQGRLAADGTLADLLASREIAVSMATGESDEASVAAALRAIDPIRAAQRTGADPALAGYSRWSLEVEEGGETSAVPALIDVALREGWRIASAAPRRLTLERYFQDLQAEHVRREQAAGSRP